MYEVISSVVYLDERFSRDNFTKENKSPKGKPEQESEEDFFGSGINLHIFSLYLLSFTNNVSFRLELLKPQIGQKIF